MLKLKGITKDYVSGDSTVKALKGIDIEFRENEFVSILGPSGCGKTTLLNIIGGLDRYTDGDLIINGRSTKDFKDRDWDTYRNHSVGFVFQSYNLIPHQSVLANVELALTLSGVSKAERRRRAIEALEKVGLGDQLKKRPSQMSGGQMQRVAIARALVNDPDILLADEPTGALDTTTSVQIMEILKDISKDKLIVMVTHNPELAQTYSSRIIKVLDGLVTDDSDPYVSVASDMAAEDVGLTKKAREIKKNSKGKKKQTSMSFFTALSLSLNNLATKKGRTIMTSFAGSIGIIGIALILALSTGINAFIAQVQEDTLSTYPLTIQKQTQDMSAMLSAMTSVSNTEDYRDSGKIYVDDSLGTMMSAMTSTVENNLEAFKVHLDENYDYIKDYVSDIQYTYDYELQVFSIVYETDENGKIILDDNGDPVVADTRKVGMETVFEHMGEAFSGMSELMEMGGSMGGMNVFSEMIDNQTLLDQQYDVIAGNWPKEFNEVVLVVNSNNQISKMTLYMLGILDPNEIDKEMEDLMGGKYEPKDLPPYTYEDILNMRFMLLTTSEFFDESGKVYTVDGVEYPVWNDLREGFSFDQKNFVTENGIEIKISGIIRPKESAAATSISGAVGYTKDLTDYILKQNETSGVINQQKETPEVNVLTGLPFERTKYTPETIHELVSKIDDATMDMFYAYMTQQILSNPDFSDRIQVTDTESFIGMFMLLPAENQAQIFSAVLGAAQADPNNKDTIDNLCLLLSATTGGIDIRANNFVRLLPVLDVQTQVLGALMGIPPSEQMPSPTPGLIQMAGEDAMNVIYEQLTESIKAMTVNEEIFVTLLSTLTEDDPAFIQLEEQLYTMAPQIDATYDSVLDTLDDAKKASPASINFYAKDFESKEAIEKFISDYNTEANEKYVEEYEKEHGVKPEGKAPDELQYTDLVGSLMSSVTIIINAISYVLIAFVSISLVVSSIMIGIITNISVLERTKEIGILRAIGASKKDVSRVFNAETLIIGLAAGAIGILTTVLLCIPISAIVQYFTGLDNIRAILPWQGALILVLISMILTLIAGIIPSRSAAKKDPVVALRSE
ncbi:MAG: ATP-binding cassette domain-containing protein [Ruminococcaceae bacterium]|nr:ATP-binding cassette domain-containing protein [Oscillospiraceae bacterium]